jgi:hypothetical protein
MSLAVVRVVRLVTTDDITQSWRTRLAARSTGDPTLIVRLVNCDWCVGVWVAAVAAVLGRVSGLVPTWPWAAWAWVGMAGGAGLLSKVA